MRQNEICRGGPSGAAATTGTGRTPRAGAGAGIVAAAGARGERRGDWRRGVASVLALLYMTIFSALALGFYATVCMSTQVAYNEARSASAQLAAESGLELMRHHLGQLDVPADTAPQDVLGRVYAQLAARLQGTNNLGTRRVGYVAPVVTAAGVTTPGVVTVPAGTSEFISLGGGGQSFRAVITGTDRQLRVKVVGRSGPGGAFRGVEMEFTSSQNDGRIFDFGVAAKGPIRLGSGTVVAGTPSDTDASLFSAASGNPVVSMASNAVLAGDIYFSEEAGSVSLASSASVAGSTITAVRDTHVHAGAEPPPFPIVDTSEYWPFVLKPNGTPNYYTKGMGKDLANCVLKPGSYNFNSQVRIQGVLFIQTPCSVTFGGGVSIQGVIVVQNNPTGTPAENVLDFQGNGQFQGVESLPATAEFPAALRAKAGSLILAPNFTLKFGGNFGTVGGSVAASGFAFGGTSSGTVRGTLVALGTDAVSLAGKRLDFDHSSVVRNPPGLFFGFSFAPRRNTYAEVSP